jgi:hypothetical protein
MLWRLNFAVLRPTAMTISYIQRIANIANEEIRNEINQWKTSRTVAELKVAQSIKRIEKDALENVREQYSYLFGNKYGRVSAQKFHDNLGKFTAMYFHGANANYNPLTCKLFRQAYTTIVDYFAHRVGFLQPSAYCLNLELPHDQQQHSEQHQPYHSIWNLLSVHTLRKIQTGSSFFQGEQQRLDVEEGALRQSGHSKKIHEGRYGNSRHANPGFRGLSVFLLRKMLDASLWFQKEIIETSVPLAFLLEVIILLR